MSHKVRTRGTAPYVHKIVLNSNNRRVRRKPLKLCPDCKETSDLANTLYNKVNELEEVINSFKNFLRKTTPMEVDNPFEYARYCSNDWDPMDLD
jgi:hypothetical protein